MIKARYGDDLEHPVHSLDFTRKQSRTFYSSVIPRMREIAAREGLTDPTAETNLDSDAAVQEENHTPPVEIVTEAGNVAPNLEAEAEEALVEAVDSTVAEFATNKQAFRQDTLEVSSNESLESPSGKTTLGTVVAEPQTETNATIAETRIEGEKAILGHEVGDSTAVTESQLVGDSATTKQKDTVLVASTENEDISLTNVPEHFSSEEEKLSSMSEAQLDVYLQHLSRECAGIEKRMAEKRNKLDDAISLYERRERLLAREKELDLEIASKLNSLQAAKEKVNKK